MATKESVTEANVSKSSTKQNSLTKSKERVSNFGEVFTPEWMVKKMLDQVKETSERVDAKVLEPSCGEGAFLIELLRRKLGTVKSSYPAESPDRAYYGLFALMNLYGIELLEDNLEKCRENLHNIFSDFIEQDLSVKNPDAWRKASKKVIEYNITQGDALTMLNSSGKPVEVSEWSYNPDEKTYIRKIYTYQDLCVQEDFKGTLFQDSEDLLKPRTEEVFSV